MKKTNRLLAFILCICMMVSIMPPIQIVHAADTVKRYELATDGIEAGATYLIVNTSSTGSGNALRFYYSSSSSRDLRNQAVTVRAKMEIHISNPVLRTKRTVRLFSAIQRAER